MKDMLESNDNNVKFQTGADFTGGGIGRATNWEFGTEKLTALRTKTAQLGATVINQNQLCKV